jgi:antitoxin component of MazEF toxin-antitoxin module
MIKKLVRHGNSLALVIDKPILELLNMSGQTPLELKTDGRSLIITPAPRADRATALDQFLAGEAPRLAEALRGVGV